MRKRVHCLTWKGIIFLTRTLTRKRVHCLTWKGIIFLGHRGGDYVFFYCGFHKDKDGRSQKMKDENSITAEWTKRTALKITRTTRPR